MGTYTRSHSFTAGEKPTEAQWNVDIDGLITLCNGQIDKANVDSSSTDGIVTMDEAQTISGAKTFSSDILTSGSGIVVGASSQVVISDGGGATHATPEVQVLGTGFDDAAALLACFSTTATRAAAPTLALMKSGHGTLGSNTVVTDNEILGSIIAYGADGTDFESPAAAIEFAVDGTPGTGDMPGEIKMYTTADSGETLTLALTLSAAQAATFAGTLSSGAATVASLVCTAEATFGGGYGSTGATISTAGVVQANGAITSGGVITGTGFTIGSAAIVEAELETIDGVTAGTVSASKALIVDSNKDIASLRNITLTGELDAGSLDVSGDADIDGTLEADAITIGSTAIGSIYGVVAGSSSIVTTGALDSGSITSGFGTIDTGSSTITTTGVIAAGGLTLGSAVIVEAELETIDGITAGTVVASKALVVDSNKDIASLRNITLTGELDAGSLDVSGDANVAGEVQTAGIGYTDGDNAITIADGGACTFPQTGTFSGLVQALTGGVGIARTEGTLHVHTATAGSVTANTSYDDLVIENSTYGGITILTPNDVIGSLAFGDPENNDDGVIRYDHSTAAMEFFTAGAVRASLTSGGILGINETANTQMTIGLTINQGAADDSIFAGKSSDVGHDMTDEFEADTFFAFQKSDVGGGLNIRAYKDGSGAPEAALTLDGNLGEAAESTETTASDSVTMIRGFITNGSGGTADVADGGNVFNVANRGTTHFLVKGNGDLYGSDTSITAFDDAEDVMVLRSAELSLRTDGIIPTSWDEEVHDRYHYDRLVDMGLIGYVSPDELAEGIRPLVNLSMERRLTRGALWQGYIRDMELQKACDYQQEQIESLKAELLLLKG